MGAKRIFWLTMFLPPHWLARFFQYLAELAFEPLYRENTRLEEIRRASTASGGAE